MIILSGEGRKGRHINFCRGSSIKFCLIAEGKADVYPPRFGPTMEWDTAAGTNHCSCREKVSDFKTGKTLLYNKEHLRNDWFVVE